MSEEEPEPSSRSTPAPPVLSYSTPREHPTSNQFFIGSLILALIFVVTFWIVEKLTSDALRPVLMASGTPAYWEKIRSKQISDLVIEFLWSIPATVVAYICLAAVGPRRGFRLNGKVVITAIGGAIVYSWVRWALDFTPMHPSEDGDFWLAMMLAALAGVGTSIVRSKIPSR